MEQNSTDGASTTLNKRENHCIATLACSSDSREPEVTCGVSVDVTSLENQNVPSATGSQQFTQNVRVLSPLNLNSSVVSTDPCFAKVGSEISSFKDSPDSDSVNSPASSALQRTQCEPKIEPIQPFLVSSPLNDLLSHEQQGEPSLTCTTVSNVIGSLVDSLTVAGTTDTSRPTVLNETRDRPSPYLSKKARTVNPRIGCAVPDCSNSMDTYPAKRFYQSPIDLDNRLAWLQAMSVRSLKAIKFYVCEDHFPNDLNENIMYVNGSCRSINGLSVVPSLNLPNRKVISYPIKKSALGNACHRPHSASMSLTPKVQRSMIPKTPLLKNSIEKHASPTFQNSSCDQTDGSAENGVPSSTFSHYQSTTKDILALLNGNIAKLIAYVQPSIRAVGVSTVNVDKSDAAGKTSAKGDADKPESDHTVTISDAGDAITKETTPLLMKLDPSTNIAGCQSSKLIEISSSLKSPKTDEISNILPLAPIVTKSPGKFQQASKPSQQLSSDSNSELAAKLCSDGNVIIGEMPEIALVSDRRSKYNTRRSRTPRGSSKDVFSNRFSFRFPPNEYVSDISSCESFSDDYASDISNSSWASEISDSFGRKRKRPKRSAKTKKLTETKTQSKKPKMNDAEIRVAADENLMVSMEETVATVQIGNREFSCKKIHPLADQKSADTYKKRLLVVSESTDVPDWKKNPPQMPPSLNTLMKGMNSCFDDFIKKMEDMHLAFKEQFAGNKDVIKLADDWFLVLIDRLEMFPAMINSELSRLVETCRQFFSDEAQKAIKENKKSRWCVKCWEPARFHCCFEAAYCSTLCQTKDWTKHKVRCSQSQCSLSDPNLKLNQLLTERIRKINNSIITIGDLEHYIQEQTPVNRGAPVPPVPSQKRFRPLLPSQMTTIERDKSTKNNQMSKKPSFPFLNNKSLSRCVTNTKNDLLKPSNSVKFSTPVNGETVLLPPSSIATYTEALDGICVVDEPDPLVEKSSEASSDSANEDCNDEEVLSPTNLERLGPHINKSLSFKFMKEISDSMNIGNLMKEKKPSELQNVAPLCVPHFLESSENSDVSNSSRETTPLETTATGTVVTLKKTTGIPTLPTNIASLLNGGLKPIVPGAKPFVLKMVTLASGETQLVPMDDAEISANQNLISLASEFMPQFSQSVKSSGSVVATTQTLPRQMKPSSRTVTITTSSVRPNSNLSLQSLAPKLPSKKPTATKSTLSVPLPNLTPIIKKETTSVRVIDDPALDRILNSDHLLMSAFESTFYKNTRARD